MKAMKDHASGMNNHISSMLATLNDTSVKKNEQDEKITEL